ncbi:MAG: NADH-quinone oxidoreductase subunit J family protein [Candidatus Syntropharchaeales archaeon]|nr:NADH-quinone oxidoreductase subunit J [Candidatus Syntrophoarchaeum sp.]
MLESLVFGSVALILILSSIMVVKSRQVMHSALSLAAMLIGVAGIYVMLQAEFLAAVQILVYAGGVVILIVFAIFMMRWEK